MRVTINRLQKMKDEGFSIPMISAYDYTSACILEDAGIPIILVGDSLGNVVLGYDSTIPVTMDDMLRHTQMVVRGTKKAHIVADMPFMSYQTGVRDAICNAGRLIKEGGCQSVKLEGGEPIVEIVQSLVQFGIPVMGHLGLTPQSVNQLGGYRVQGKEDSSGEKLLNEALMLQNAGAYAIVLELVPAKLAEKITASLDIPTIGIGAGPKCDGQVQIFHDMLGLFPDFSPKHARKYMDLNIEIKKAVQSYIKDVQKGLFPSDQESF